MIIGREIVDVAILNLECVGNILISRLSLISLSLSLSLSLSPSCLIDISITQKSDNRQGLMTGTFHLTAPNPYHPPINENLHYAIEDCYNFPEEITHHLHWNLESFFFLSSFPLKSYQKSRKSIKVPLLTPPTEPIQWKLCGGEKNHLHLLMMMGRK